MPYTELGVLRSCAGIVHDRTLQVFAFILNCLMNTLGLWNSVMQPNSMSEDWLLLLQDVFEAAGRFQSQSICCSWMGGRQLHVQLPYLRLSFKGRLPSLLAPNSQEPLSGSKDKLAQSRKDYSFCFRTLEGSLSDSCVELVSTEATILT